MKTGIYKITNTLNKKVYIGSALDLNRRFCRHKEDLRRGKHHNQKLRNAWVKYGPDAFTFEILLYCSKEHLLDYEQRCINGFDSVRSGYNISPTAGNCMGVKHTLEARGRMAAAQQNRTLSEDVRSKISLRFKGISKTPEHREKIAAAQRGRGLSPEHLEKLRASHQRRREESMRKKEAKKAADAATRIEKRNERDRMRQESKSAKIEARRQRSQAAIDRKTARDQLILQGERALKTIQKLLQQEFMRIQPQSS